MDHIISWRSGTTQRSLSNPCDYSGVFVSPPVRHAQAFPRKGTLLMPQRLLPLMILTVIALLFVPINSVRADSGESGLHITIDGYSASLIFPDGSPKAGPNTVVVQLDDASGQPLSGAIVQVAVLAAHESAALAEQLGAHEGDAAAPHADGEHIDTIMTQLTPGPGAGEYSSVLHFDSAGAWPAQIEFAAFGVSHTGSFTVAVAEPAGDWRLLGVFGGANALIIVTAGVLKRRLGAAPKPSRVAVAPPPED